MSTLVNRVLLIDEDTQGIGDKLDALQQSNSECYYKLIGVCYRLSFIDQVRALSFVGSIPFENKNFFYQIDRLSTYLTTTCIDVLTNEHFQTYDRWLEESYKGGLLGDTWNQAIAELSKGLTPDKTASAFVKWTKKLHKDGYEEKTSIRRAFKNFVSDRDDWLKNWLLQNYIVEELNSKSKFRKGWQVMSDVEKCRNIAHYLYALRNLYTHRVTDYQAMEYVQRNNSNLPDKYQVKGFFAIIFPSTSKDEPYRRISLPEDKRESDVIRLLVITWIRKHWLQIVTDNDCFIQKYWERRITQ
jgi:hypothetical protein